MYIKTENLIDRLIKSRFIENPQKLLVDDFIQAGITKQTWDMFCKETKSGKLLRSDIRLLIDNEFLRRN